MNESKPAIFVISEEGTAWIEVRSQHGHAGWLVPAPDTEDGYVYRPNMEAAANMGRVFMQSVVDKITQLKRDKEAYIITERGGIRVLYDGTFGRTGRIEHVGNTPLYYHEVDPTIPISVEYVDRLAKEMHDAV